MKALVQIILLSFIGSLLFSCEEEAAAVAIIEQTTVDIDTITLRATRQLKPALKLTPSAAKAVADWKMYSALEKMTAEYNAITFADLKVRIAQGVQLFVQQEQAEEAAIKLVPDHINTPAIKARLLVLETRMKVLQDLTEKYQPDLEKIESEMISIRNAFQDLNLQINERFGKSVDQLLEELRKAQSEDEQNQPSPNSQGRPPLSLSETY